MRKIKEKYTDPRKITSVPRETRYKSFGASVGRHEDIQERYRICE
jgi:hypothetical protein